LDHIETLRGRFTDFEEEQSGRHIQLTQTLETNISRFATQESISNAISEKVDPVLDWMETSIKSPLALCNNAVQDNANFSKMHFHETRAMSASISSFGSQLSQQSEQIQEIRKLVENLGASRSRQPGATSSVTSMNSYNGLFPGDISPRHSPMQTPQEARGAWPFLWSDPPVRHEARPLRIPSVPFLLPVKQFKYSCEAILGIEETFVCERCVYCGLTFDADSDWKLRGKHLVEDHSFNECDSEIFYDTWDAYFKHLTISHHATDFVCCSREMSTFLRPQADLRQLSREVSIVFPKTFQEDNELQQWLTDNEYNLNCKESHERDLVLLDLRHAIQGLSETDFGLGVQCLSDFTQEALNLLWEIDWQICCAKERCIVNELQFPLESDQIMEVCNDKCPIFPAATSPTTKLEIYKNYVSQIQLHCPIGPQTLADFKIRLRKIIESTGEDVTRVFGGPLSRSSICKLLLQTKEFPVSLPEAMDVSVCRRKRIDEWLFQMFGVSYTSRILISYHSEIRCPGSGGALDWMLQNIVHWTLEAPENDLLLPISDGAIDSRDDLVSMEIKFGAQHRDVPPQPPLPPPRFPTDIAQHEDRGLDHVWEWGKPSQEDGGSSLLFENFASRNMSKEPADFGYAGRFGFKSSVYVRPLSVSNTQAYDQHLLQKLDFRRVINNRTLSSESRTSRGGYMHNDAPLRRRSRRSFSSSGFLHSRLVSPPRPPPVSQNKSEKAGCLTVASWFKSHRVFICECCPKKPKKFDTQEELKYIFTCSLHIS
jgi:hypothetical protein